MVTRENGWVGMVGLWMVAVVVAGAVAVGQEREKVLVTSSVDGSEQPCYVILPEGFDPKGPAVPLLVSLHTWSGDMEQRSADMEREAIRRGWITVWPNFRGPNQSPDACGSELAQQDILDAIDWALKRYPIDRERIYLTGASGGGHMAMLMAGRHPQRFSAVSAWVGISDLAAWHARHAEGKYGRMLRESCGGPPGQSPEVDAEYRKRSPLTWLARAVDLPLDLAAGVHDGHAGSVPIRNTLDAFNTVAAAEGKPTVTEEEIAQLSRPDGHLEKPQPQDTAEDPTFGRAIYLRRTAGKCRVRFLVGGPERVAHAAAEWLSHQKRQTESDTASDDTDPSDDARTTAGDDPTADADFSQANRFFRDGAIEYGNAQFDPQTNLVWRVDGGHHALDVCQHSLEYAAALLAAGEKLDRANAVLAAVLDHQDLDEDSPTFGNFLWWHGETRVRDRNAVAFMSPWLAHVAMEHADKLTPENARRLRQSLDHCIRGVRAHGSGPDYTNIWLLKAASMVLLGRALGQPELEADGSHRLDQWIELAAQDGLSEYNSPCYNAVDVYALEWIYHYANDDGLRRKVAGCLDYLYADIFQQWHWEAGIGAGTHSRAYQRDRDSGRSLVSCLVFKQCGQPMRQEMRSFLYVFAVNDYPVPGPIRAAARKQGMYPFQMRYRVLRGAAAVECSLYMTSRFSLGTQTGRRPVHNDRPLWDLPLKITYAGTRTERRASYIAPAPTTKHATIASVEHGPTAIVLYEVDMASSGLTEGRLRLDIEPAEGGMCDEIVVAGRSYDRSRLALEPGTVIGWRVADTLVALRLLDSRGLKPDRPGEPGPVPYQLGPVPETGLCLDCPLVHDPAGPVTVDDLSAGFVIACATTEEHKSLAAFLDAFDGWTVDERIDGAKREIEWQPDATRLQLVWDGANNRAVSRTVDGRPVATELRYDSPLVHLADGDRPAVVPVP